jgi:hypothetical protein
VNRLRLPRPRLLAAAALSLLVPAMASRAVAQQVPPAQVSHANATVRALLNGWQEVPSISTIGEGEFIAHIEDAAIVYELTYVVETPAAQAHIHLGQRAANGGVIAFLCGGGDKPPCPQVAGTVEGVIDPTDVIGPANQGIEPGNFPELVRALLSGNTYANVHTTRFPGGEIRGQIRDDRDIKE